MSLNPPLMANMGYTLFRKCHNHNTQECILAAEWVENRFWQNKRLIYGTY